MGKMAACGDGGLRVEAVRCGSVAFERKPKQPDQGGMLDKKGADIGHIPLLLMQLDQIRGDKAGTIRRWFAWAGRRVKGGGTCMPIQWMEQRVIRHRHGAIRDPGG